jgi:hypothetical protein
MNSREGDVDVNEQVPEQPYPTFEYSEAQIWIQTPATRTYFPSSRRVGCALIAWT